MREIKFRAWDKVRKHWIFKPRWKICYNDVNTDLLQYIGLKDSNGREIYERYILKCDQFSSLVEIKWDVETMQMRMKGSDPHSFYWKDFESWIFKGNVLTNFTIIGNIYENKELLT